MGWLNEFEQQKVLSLYGRQSQYRCNNCRRLIWLQELEVVDPKGGYHSLGPKATYGSKYSRPKVCYCPECDRIRRGKAPVANVPASATNGASVSEWILQQLKENPRGEWKARKLIKLYPGSGDTNTLIREAVRELKKEKKIARVGGYLVIKLKEKKK